MGFKRVGFWFLLVFLFQLHHLPAAYHVRALNPAFKREQNTNDIGKETLTASSTVSLERKASVVNRRGGGGGGHGRGSTGKVNGNGGGKKSPYNQNQGPNLIPVYAAGQSIPRYNSNQRHHGKNEATRNSHCPCCLVLLLLAALVLLV